LVCDNKCIFKMHGATIKKKCYSVFIKVKVNYFQFWGRPVWNSNFQVCAWVLGTTAAEKPKQYWKCWHVQKCCYEQTGLGVMLYTHIQEIPGTAAFVTEVFHRLPKYIGIVPHLGHEHFQNL
jgi:hypothetical protein